MNEPVVRDVALTCHTQGCENDGITITLSTDAEQYLCGACGVRITDALE